MWRRTSRITGRNVGLMRIMVFRPFPKVDVRRVARKFKKVGVIDRNISFGSEGIFFQEVKSALCNESGNIGVYGFVAGLGGRDIVPDDFANILKKIEASDKATDITWIGLKK